MMGVLLDVESTLANTNRAFLTQYNNLHETNYTTDDIDSWEWVETEVDYDEFMRLVDRAWKEGLIEPLESGLDETVAALAEEYTVDIVTARIGVEAEMQDWLTEHGITDYESFKSVNPSYCKSQEPYHFLCDDRPYLAENLRPHQTQFMVKHPWNRSHWNHPNVVGVESVKQAAEILLE